MLVSEPKDWGWVVFPCLPDPIVGFALHNTSYRVTVQYRYWVWVETGDPDFPFDFVEYGPYQTSIIIHVQNLVVTSSDETKVLRWDPEKGIADTTFGYARKCAQRKPVQVTIRIFSMDGRKVYEVTEGKMCPGSYSFRWDGRVNVWEGDGYPSEEGSNIALAGLYTFDVLVQANPYDGDRLRSGALTVEPGPVEYYGYDDGGTPEDESDDGYFYYIRWYRLCSRIWFYRFPEVQEGPGWQKPGMNRLLLRVLGDFLTSPLWNGLLTENICFSKKVSDLLS